MGESSGEGLTSLNHIDQKIQKLKGLDDLDPGLLPVLERFNRLPFVTEGSCSGHTDSEGKLLVNSTPHISFRFDDQNEFDRRTQKKFRRDIPNFADAVARRLDAQHGDIKIGLHGYFVEMPNGEWIELPIDETIAEGLTLGLEVDVRDQKLRENGTATLNTFWTAFWDYLDGLDGNNEPLPNFEGGKIFVLSDRHDKTKSP